MAATAVRRHARRSPMSDLDKDIQRLLATYESAVLKKDVRTFMHLYDPEVQVFDAWGIWCHHGAEAWQLAVEGWFQDVTPWPGKDVSSVRAIVTYEALSASGEPLRRLQNRLSWVLRTSGHVARIVH